MADNEGKRSVVDVVLKRGRDAVKVRDDLVDKGNLLLGYFRCCVEENLEKQSVMYTTNSKDHVHRGEARGQQEAATRLKRA